MPLPNVSSTPTFPNRPENRQGQPINPIDPNSGLANALQNTQTAPDPLSLQLQRELEGIIGEGGVGLSPEQLDVQFRGIEQQLQPQFNAQIERIDEQASRRGVFRSGIPLKQAQTTQREQAKQLGNIRVQMTTENERRKNQTLLTALGMLQSLESDMANRELYLKALDELKKSQDQGAYLDLLGQFGSFALNTIFPGAGTAAKAIAPSSGSSRPSGGF